MKIEDKIAHIDRFCKSNKVWSVDCDDRWVDVSSSLPACLKNKVLIDENTYSILENLRKKGNFYENKYENERLKPESILYANLIYKILIDNKL